MSSAEGATGVWSEHRVQATLVAAVALVVPVAVSVAAAVAVSRAVPQPSAILPVVCWWIAVLGVSLVVITLSERVTRRLLPLAALLRLSLVFPDRAPSRFRVAFRAGTIRNLEQRVLEARELGTDTEPVRAAATILELVGALSAHDRRTRGHSERVRAYADLIAEELGLDEDDRERLRWASLLHDVGKLHVAPSILNKAGRPTDAEWRTLHAHPVEGARLAAPLASWLGPWADTIAEHHERFDGAGYPKGLAGADISLGARIVAVADSFEVMTAVRSYKRPVPAHAARAELARGAGSQFDPAVVRAFLALSIGRLRQAMGPVAWVAQLPFVGALPRLEADLVAAGQHVPGTAAAAAGVAAMGVAAVVSPLAGTGLERAEAAGSSLERYHDSLPVSDGDGVSSPSAISGADTPAGGPGSERPWPSWPALPGDAVGPDDASADGGGSATGPAAPATRADPPADRPSGGGAAALGPEHTGQAHAPPPAPSPPSGSANQPTGPVVTPPAAPSATLPTLPAAAPMPEPPPAPNDGARR